MGVRDQRAENTDSRKRRFLNIWLISWGVKWVALAVLALTGCGPIGPFPGGALTGELGPDIVASWSFAEEEETAQLETRPTDPHSVNTWFAAIGPDLYVPTSMILGPKTPGKRSWVNHVAEDNGVRVRIDGKIFERRANRIDQESAEYQSARAALETRYDLQPEDRDPSRTIWIYRLDPRSEAN